MQIILTEEEYNDLKAAREVARADVKSLAAHMTTEWVKKAIPEIKNFVSHGWSNVNGDADLLRRLGAIKLE